jgi:hypothetical protein
MNGLLHCATHDGAVSGAVGTHVGVSLCELFAEVDGFYAQEFGGLA